MGKKGTRKVLVKQVGGNSRFGNDEAPAHESDEDVIEPSQFPPVEPSMLAECLGIIGIYATENECRQILDMLDAAGDRLDALTSVQSTVELLLARAMKFLVYVLSSGAESPADAIYRALKGQMQSGDGHAGVWAPHMRARDFGSKSACRQKVCLLDGCHTGVTEKGYLYCSTKEFHSDTRYHVMDMRYVFQDAAAAEKFVTANLPYLSESEVTVETPIPEVASIAPQVRVFEQSYRKLRTHVDPKELQQVRMASFCFLWTCGSVVAKLWVSGPPLNRHMMQRCVKHCSESLNTWQEDFGTSFEAGGVPSLMKKFHQLAVENQILGRFLPRAATVTNGPAASIGDAGTPAKLIACKVCGEALPKARYSKRVWKDASADSAYEPTCLSCKSDNDARSKQEAYEASVAPPRQEAEAAVESTTIEAATEASPGELASAFSKTLAIAESAAGDDEHRKVVVGSVAAKGYHVTLVEFALTTLQQTATFDILLKATKERQASEDDCPICFNSFVDGEPTLLVRWCCRQAICDKCEVACHSNYRSCSFCRQKPVGAEEKKVRESGERQFHPSARRIRGTARNRDEQTDA